MMPPVIQLLTGSHPGVTLYVPVGPGEPEMKPGPTLYIRDHPELVAWFNVLQAAHAEVAAIVRDAKA